MATYTYIGLSLIKKIVTFENPLPPEQYSLGETWEDYLDGKWVILSAEQEAFYFEHPDASVPEVWKMELNPPYVRTLEDAKREMKFLIDEYDSSDHVNVFTINHTVKGWLTPAERTNYRASIDAAKLVGLETVSFFVGDNLFTITPVAAEQMLAQIQLYADACYIVTKQHKIAVDAMEMIEDVDSFDYHSGYPEVINFDVA